MSTDLRRPCSCTNHPPMFGYLLPQEGERATAAQTNSRRCRLRKADWEIVIVDLPAGRRPKIRQGTGEDQRRPLFSLPQLAPALPHPLFAVWEGIFRVSQQVAAWMSWRLCTYTSCSFFSLRKGPFSSCSGVARAAFWAKGQNARPRPPPARAGISAEKPEAPQPIEFPTGSRGQQDRRCLHPWCLSLCATWLLDVCIASDMKKKTAKNRKLWLRSREKAAGFFFTSRLAAVASLSPFVAGHAHSPQPRCPHTSAGARVHNT